MPWCSSSGSMPRRRGSLPLPLENERRQKARDLKLLGREIQLATERGDRRIWCPCRICNRGIRTLLSHPTVKKHIRWYGYHPRQRGSTEGVERDASDVEWDESISRELEAEAEFISRVLGAAAARRREPQHDPAAANVDIVEVLRAAHGVADYIRDVAAEGANEREPRRQPTQP
ncbi:hypothetical protein KC19_11G104200 [Ceratodon purpureus]|uniref:Uncharacterized protein n=1 Tax=Ceratodon purpureus TaxID=3225 RepID=A0A8T0GH60_CERPU|nr:hypothetical protein KC19_11G104200 [Ceratodon purpureus]